MEQHLNSRQWHDALKSSLSVLLSVNDRCYLFDPSILWFQDLRERTRWMHVVGMEGNTTTICWCCVAAQAPSLTPWRSKRQSSTSPSRVLTRTSILCGTASMAQKPSTGSLRHSSSLADSWAVHQDSPIWSILVGWIPAISGNQLEAP